MSDRRNEPESPTSRVATIAAILVLTGGLPLLAQAAPGPPMPAAPPSHLHPGHDHAAAAPAATVADETMSQCPMHAAHSGVSSAPASSLTQPGEAIFGALSEVISRLDADAATDWSKVDLDRLRDHLVQMDRVYRGAEVESEALADGARYVVSGDAPTLAAVRALVVPHASMVQMEQGWSVEVADQPERVEVTVRSPTPGQAARIRGLGFFGLLAVGDHHRAHHWMMATGS